MRELEPKELALAIWSNTDPGGSSLAPLVSNIVDHFSAHPNLGKVTEQEGPTFHIPDFFNDRFYGTFAGWIIYIANSDPSQLKELAMQWEVGSDRKRMADIDVYLSYFEKISRRRK